MLQLTTWQLAKFKFGLSKCVPRVQNGSVDRSERRPFNLSSRGASAVNLLPTGAPFLGGLVIITKFEQLDEVRKFIAQNPVLAYDTETTGLNTRKEQIIGFALSNGQQSYYICHKTWENDGLQVKIPYSACKSLLELLKQNTKIKTWNAAFDLDRKSVV